MAPKSWCRARAQAWCCRVLLPAGDRNPQDVERTLLEGRFCEIRMLFYVGKDLLRWIDQCLELAARSPELSEPGIKYQSFAAYLVSSTPEAVQTKLKKWGVSDFKASSCPRLGIERDLLHGSREGNAH